MCSENNIPDNPVWDRARIDEFWAKMCREEEERAHARLTGQQQEFVRRLDAQNSCGSFTVHHNGSSASVSAKGEMIYVSMHVTLPEARNKHDEQQLLATICRCADESQVQLIVAAQSKREIDPEELELVSWCHENGFLGHPIRMIRAPMSG